MFSAAGKSAVTSGYNINNSLRFRSSASAYLSRTPASTGSRQKFTYSYWIKRGTLGALQRYVAASDNATGDFIIDWTSGDALDVYDYTAPTTNIALTTTQVFRDPSAWYHIVIAFDTTQATASNRVKVYVNGSQVSSFSSSTYPALNANLYNNQASIPARIGIWPSGSQYLDGYLADFNFIDGQALTPSSFGETDGGTGVWKSKKYAGTYGTNGFYLNFSNIALTSGSNAGLGKDSSGNGNYWNTNNISVTSGVTYDAMLDSPTNTSATVANYAVLNPLGYTGVFTFADGNLKVTGTAGGNNIQAQGTIFVNSGKWYWEITDLAGGAGSCIGISDVTVSTTTAVGTSSLSYGYLANSGNKINNGSSAAYGATFGANDVIGVALDLSAGTLVFYKNGVSQGTAYTGLSGTFSAAVGDNSAASTPSYAANFGQRPFTYTPPSGFVALNTFNLTDSTIKKGSIYMDATTYTGTGSAQSITNSAGMQPDLVWIKARNAVSYHGLTDSVRGRAYPLFSNATDAEGTSASDKDLTSFNSNGFSLGIGNQYNSNATSNTYVAWQWSAGLGTTTVNTSGSISSNVSVNTTAGFSIVTYTGTGANATVGHGLGVAPKMVIIKNRTAAATAWNVYQASIPSGNLLSLNSTAASFANTNRITAVSSTTFSIGTDSDVNGSTNSHVAYCWAEIAGFSKFGSYTGNNSSDGPFVYLGFRPKYVLIKNSTSALNNWAVYDGARDTYNIGSAYLRPNTNGAESTYAGIDFLSNGFKLRNTDSSINDGSTYIYAAYAENPFKNALAR